MLFRSRRRNGVRAAKDRRNARSLWVARHMLILEEIAQHLPVRLDYFQIGRRPEEKGAWAQLRRLVADYLEFSRRLKKAKAEGGPVVAHVNSSVRPVCVVRDGGFVLLSRLLRVPVITKIIATILYFKKN